MSLICPNCEARLKAFTIKAHFSCPSCKTKLSGKITGPIITAIVISMIADSFIYSYVYSTYGTDWWPGVVIRVIASGSVFFVLWAFMINVFGRVAFADE